MGKEYEDYELENDAISSSYGEYADEEEETSDED